MRGGIFVYPALFCIVHSLSSRHLARRSSPVKKAAFRTVAEGLEPVPFLGWVPVVDDHLHRHPVTPHAGRALGVISPSIQTTMFLGYDRFQGRAALHETVDRLMARFRHPSLSWNRSSCKTRPSQVANQGPTSINHVIPCFSEIRASPVRHSR